MIRRARRDEVAADERCYAAVWLATKQPLEEFDLTPHVDFIKMIRNRESNGGIVMLTNPKARDVKAIATVVVTTASLAVAPQLHARPFSFAGVEYLTHDQRVPAAQAFVAEKLPPGTPIASALKTLRRASAFCRTPRAPGEPISCTHASFDRDPLYAQLADVTWTVKVTPSADGTVAEATVRRSTNGF